MIVDEGLLVIISCHGLKHNQLIGSDGKAVRLKLLQELVNSELAPAFAGSPKVFIINACRGEDDLPELEFDGASTISNIETDFFVAFANVVTIV